MSFSSIPFRILLIVLWLWAPHVHSFLDGSVIKTFDLKFGHKLGVVHHMSRKENENTLVTNIKNFFKELDNFVDDATARRLGNGSAFYGKRKSNFYGENDANKKRSDGFDPQEDYRGPDSSGFFKWVEDEETGQMVPVSRMKYKNLEKRIPYDAAESEVTRE